MERQKELRGDKCTEVTHFSMHLCSLLFFPLECLPKQHFLTSCLVLYTLVKSDNILCAEVDMSVWSSVL